MKQEQLTINLATSIDLPQILKVLDNCKIKMKSDEIDQWDDTYPNCSHFESALKSKSLYVLIINKEIIGTVTIDSEKSRNDTFTNWKDNNYLVIHRLMIDPKYQGKGFAFQAMKYAEDKAVIFKKTSLRLDVYCKNLIANNLYQKLGYSFRGQMQIQNRCYNFYEKILLIEERTKLSEEFLIDDLMKKHG